MNERLQNRHPLRRTIIGATLSVLALSGCGITHKASTGGDTPAPATLNHDTTESDNGNKLTRAEKLWGDATRDLREKISKHEPVTLGVAMNECVYWEAAAEGFDSVIRNPAFYTYKDGEESVSLVVFIPSRPKDDWLLAMNGPYIYRNQVDETQDSATIDAMHLSQTELQLTPITGIIKMGQIKNPTPYTAAWLQTENGVKVSETKLVKDTDIQTAFPETCNFKSSLPAA